MLKINNLQKKFKDHQVLNDVSFHLKQQEIITILGKNGAGKTTILNIILKLVKQDSGTILFNNQDTIKIKNSDYFSQIGTVLESSDNLYHHLTGYQNIHYFAGLLKIKKQQLTALINYYLPLFQLEEALHKKVGNYSRGMQQKLAIIIALLSKPKLLILDEPTLGLDIEAKHTMIEILKKIVVQEKLSIILTTHQMDVVEKMGGRILFLKDGKLTHYQNINQLYKKQKNNYQLIYKKEQELYTINVIAQNVNEIYEKYQQLEIVEIKLQKNLEERVMDELNATN